MATAHEDYVDEQLEQVLRAIAALMHTKLGIALDTSALDGEYVSVTCTLISFLTTTSLRAFCSTAKWSASRRLGKHCSTAGANRNPGACK
jgi:hypothetical protein